jgi:hypothetical protein
VHQLAALPSSPGDGDVSMELTNIYAEEPQAPAEPAAHVTDDEPRPAIPEAAAQPPDAALAAMQPAVTQQDSSAAAEAASPEPLMRLEDGAAAEPTAAEAEPDAATQQAQAPAEAMPLPAADPYELPPSPALADAAAHQQLATQLSEPLDGQGQPGADQPQLLASPVALAATALSSQLAVGSPLLDLGSPQPAASGGQSGSFGNQREQPESCCYALFRCPPAFECQTSSNASIPGINQCLNV